MRPRGGGDPFDVESNEREARDDLVRDRCMPTPRGDVAAALVAEGIVAAADVESAAPQIFFKLPPGWTVEPDAIQDRRFFLLDSNGQERFSIFWKAPLPFSRDVGYGSVSIVPPGDGLERHWSSEDDYSFWMRHERIYSVRCPLCRFELRGVYADLTDDSRRKMIMNRMVETIEFEFERQHKPPQPPPVVDAWPYLRFGSAPWAGALSMSIPTAPTCTIIDRDAVKRATPAARHASDRA